MTKKLNIVEKRNRQKYLRNFILTKMAKYAKDHNENENLVKINLECLKTYLKTQFSNLTFLPLNFSGLISFYQLSKFKTHSLYLCQYRDSNKGNKTLFGL